jgi:hypothetical protein
MMRGILKSAESVQFAISDFGFEMQDSSDFEILLVAHRVNDVVDAETDGAGTVL